MNKVYIIIIIAFCFYVAGCELLSNSDDFDKYNYVVDCSAGQLNTLICQKDSSINNLVLLGTLNAKDFRFIKTHLKSLEYIDLRNANVVGYFGDEGTYKDSEYQYNANEIPSGAFFSRLPAENGMPSLKEVLLPRNIIAIRSNAFNRVYSLKSIDIPEGVTSVDNVSFAVDTNLTSVRFPSTLLKIGSGSFHNCINLQTIYLNAQNPPAIDHDAFESDYINRKPYFATLIVPKGTKSIYEKSDWRIFTRIREKN
jgi:hypothetical protein